MSPQLTTLHAQERQAHKLTALENTRVQEMQEVQEMQDSGFAAQALDFSWRSTPHHSSFASPVARLPRALFSVLRSLFSRAASAAPPAPLPHPSLTS